MSDIDQSLHIFKYEALGNSYLILDPRCAGPALEQFKVPNHGILWPAPCLVRTLCDVSAGVGSNGLLFGPLPSSNNGRFGLLIINSDGTSAGFSGNGSRIFAQYLTDTGDARPGRTIEIEIAEMSDKRSHISNIANARLPAVPGRPIRVTAPHKPRFGANAVAASNQFIPLLEDNITNPLRYSLPVLVNIGNEVTGSSSAWANSVPVEIGNPHCVTFVSEPRHLPDPAALQIHSPSLRAIAFRDSRNPIFANGVNLQWAWAESRRVLRLAIYERGEGPTLASGSSACAAACAAYALRMVDAEVEVMMPGGRLTISLEGAPTDIEKVTLSGFARRILEGRVDVTSVRP